MLLALARADRQSSRADRPDILVADFEGDTYADGGRPPAPRSARGRRRARCRTRCPSAGFLGKGLVNSFLGGDGSTGTLTSPAFKIERKYLNFLVGGGEAPRRRCMNLLVGGKVVRTATGPNDKPGGSERLDWHTWDVAEFEGKDAVIEIVDDETGGWGHINVDHIVQSDTKKQAEPVRRGVRRRQALPAPAGEERRADSGASKFARRRARRVREFDIELADGEAGLLGVRRRVRVQGQDARRRDRRCRPTRRPSTR